MTRFSLNAAADEILARRAEERAAAPQGKPCTVEWHNSLRSDEGRWRATTIGARPFTNDAGRPSEQAHCVRCGSTLQRELGPAPAEADAAEGPPASVGTGPVEPEARRLAFLARLESTLQAELDAAPAPVRAQLHPSTARARRVDIQRRYMLLGADIANIDLRRDGERAAVEAQLHELARMVRDAHE